MNKTRASHTAHRIVLVLLLTLLVLACIPSAPLPTHTPYPTLAMLPTYTPQPTHTPYPSPTPRPTVTPAPTPAPTFAEKWGIASDGHIIGKPEVLLACYFDTDTDEGTNKRYWGFNQRGGKSSDLWVFIEGAELGSFVKGRCYRLAVDFLRGDRASPDSGGNAQSLTYRLVHPDAYEILSSQEYWQYRR